MSLATPCCVDPVSSEILQYLCLYIQLKVKINFGPIVNLTKDSRIACLFYRVMQNEWAILLILSNIFCIPLYCEIIVLVWKTKSFSSVRWSSILLDKSFYIHQTDKFFSSLKSSLSIGPGFIFFITIWESFSLYPLASQHSKSIIWHHKWPQASERRSKSGIFNLSYIDTHGIFCDSNVKFQWHIYNSSQNGKYRHHSNFDTIYFLCHLTMITTIKVLIWSRYFHILVRIYSRWYMDILLSCFDAEQLIWAYGIDFSSSRFAHKGSESLGDVLLNTPHPQKNY